MKNVPAKKLIACLAVDWSIRLELDQIASYEMQMTLNSNKYLQYKRGIYNTVFQSRNSEMEDKFRSR